MKRTKTMELRAIREKMNESPPPPPKDTTVREWFAGLALASADLMNGIPLNERAREAVRLADELLAALAAPKVPSAASVAAPTESSMRRWDKALADSKRKVSQRTRATVPAIPAPRPPSPKPAIPFGSLLPPPMIPSNSKDLPKTRYSSLNPIEED